MTPAERWRWPRRPPNPPQPARADPAGELVGLISRAVEAAGDRGARSRALAALIPALSTSARQAGFRAVAAGRWLTDLVLELAPRVPVRDAAALRRQHPMLTDLQIAHLLVSRASRTAAGLGAAAGGLAAVEFVAPPALLAAPVQVAAEMLAVTAVELKLVAELHEILGQPAVGTVGQRAGLYVMSWAQRRAITPELTGAGLAAILGVAGKRELRGQVLRRLGRGTSTLAPFFAGALAGAEVNRRATRVMGTALIAELSDTAKDKWFRQLPHPYRDRGLSAD
ncbi:MAG: hypothetical protein JWO63_1184 [Frankiales bacterium]|nr:hypothetical protein [Frankiales bacterium]